MSALTGVVKKVGKVLEDMATDLYELSVVTTTGSVKTIEIEEKKDGTKRQVFDILECKLTKGRCCYCDTPIPGQFD